MDDPAAMLKALEERLLDPSIRADRAALENLLAEDCCEFGSSGRVFDRESIVAALAEEQQSPPAKGQTTIEDFVSDVLAPGVALVTYRIAKDAGQGSLRSSVWVQRDGTWQMRFHQGTRVAG